MRAIVVNETGPAEVLRLADIPVPRPGPGEITIDVDYAGVGFVDTLLREGILPMPLPFVPGIEVTGRVRETGPGVEGWSLGRPVAALLNDFGRAARAGGYAEVAVAAADLAVPLPEDADLAAMAAALSNGVTAWMALHDLARICPGETVLVLGASGGLGGITAGLARVLGAGRVIGVLGSDSEAKRNAALEAGCTEVITAMELPESPGGLGLGQSLGQGLGLRLGQGIDVAVDPVGGHLRSKALDDLAPFGRLVILGGASGVDEPLSGDLIWQDTKSVMGLNVDGIAHLAPARVADAAAAVVQLVHSGTLHQPPPHLRPLAQAAEVHSALKHRAIPGKTVLTPHAPA
ncbi:quinone oxidoreductase family protein [Streptomyces sp. AK02-01A]|uniref:quinone oxidoreductase family protein n=1 Tax=Streptomyces sp. AK02-01A TaxID=3028648 RepID=UPI0029B7F1BD|nr:zinc-binding dehydrogenase [Streptomyces sp. AK02-01A]MDX3849150.1 zinc-binding dehydrogenase [Streptomyces sp. AK02-01A]